MKTSKNIIFSLTISFFVCAQVWSSARMNSTKGASLLYEAMEAGQGELVCRLLRGQEVDINFRDRDGGSPLHWAATESCADNVCRLITHGAKVNGQDVAGWTPLFGAAKQGKTDIVRVLIKHGAEVDISSQCGWQSLHFAAEGGHDDIIGLLITSGADIYAKTQDGFQPLGCALGFSRASAARLLIRLGAELTPEMAQELNQKKLCKQLIFIQDQRLRAIKAWGEHLRDKGLCSDLVNLVMKIALAESQIARMSVLG